MPATTEAMSCMKTVWSSSATRSVYVDSMLFTSVKYLPTKPPGFHTRHDGQVTQSCCSIARVKLNQGACPRPAIVHQTQLVMHK
jgi:hypothetical protein